MSKTHELWQHPLAYDPLSDWGYIRDGREHLIARVREFSLTMEEEREHRANRTDPTKERVERIVSCVNACAGIHEPEDWMRKNTAAIQAAREALEAEELWRNQRDDTGTLRAIAKEKRLKALNLLTPAP